MLKIYYRLPNGKNFAHVSHSGTTMLAAHALKWYYPDRYKRWLDEDSHDPCWYLDEYWANRLPRDCLVMVRDPIERFQNIFTSGDCDEDVVRFSLECARKSSITTRSKTDNISITTLYNLMPIDFIAENDSYFIKFPKIQQACEYLDLRYDPSIPLDTRSEHDTVLPEWVVEKLQDSIGIWEALK